MTFLAAFSIPCPPPPPQSLPLSLRQQNYQTLPPPATTKRAKLYCYCLRSCDLFNLHQHQIPYEVAWSWQKRIVADKKLQIQNDGDCSDTLIILQHPPVFTLGTASDTHHNLNFDISNPPFNIYRTERGGEVTFHGPGQLIMYPIINLRRHKMDLHWYLRTLEEVVIRALSSTFSIQASRLEGLTGVWVGNKKLAALGIRVAHWITYHGLALNVTTDLTPFKWIIPCGIHDRQVGSIEELLKEAQSCVPNRTTDLDDANLVHITHRSLLEEFSQAFQLEYHHKTICLSLLNDGEDNLPPKHSKIEFVS